MNKAENQYNFFKLVNLDNDGNLGVVLQGGGTSSPQPFAFTADNYTDLQSITGMTDGDLAYVVNAEGTQWLPGTMGGTYYPNGIYVYATGTWTSDRNAISYQLSIDDARIDKHDEYWGETDSTSTKSGLDLFIDLGNTSFGIASGHYHIVDSGGTITEVAYTGSTGNVLPTLAISQTWFIYLDINMNVIVETTTPTGDRYRELNPIGELVVLNGFISFQLDRKVVGMNLASQMKDLNEALGGINKGDAIYSPATNLTLAKTGGDYFIYGSNLQNNINVPSVFIVPPTDTNAGGTMILSKQDNIVNPSATVLDVANYDNGGTITPIGGGTNTSGNWFIYGFEAGEMVAVYPQTTYSSLIGASNNVVADLGNLVLNDLFKSGILLGVISVRRTAINLQDTSDATFTYATKFGDLGGIGGASSGGNTTLQNAYDSSTSPEIITDSTRGALTIQQNSGADTDNIFEGKNNAGTNTFEVAGNGAITTDGNTTFTGTGTYTTFTIVNGLIVSAS